MTSPGVGSPAQRLGRYHLAEPLGGGPTGEVFRAKVYGVAGFDRQFAVKRFHAEFVDDPDIAAEISTAARTYGSLEHPRIARLQEYGVTGGYTFTATELIQGLDLTRLLSVGGSIGKSLPPGAIAALISQIARTVGYAHGRGICHLGLCPTNLIVTPEGEVKITDFGFLPARLPDKPAEDLSLHARLPYLAPEQLSGQPTSAATDVFQLGVVAYELFSGKQAFTGPTPQDIARKILSSQPPALDLPKPLIKVVQRCLARSPFERYPDARALADAMDAATRSAPLAGSIHDVSTVVRAAMQHLESLGDEQVSGAVSFPLPAPPRAQQRRPTGDGLDDSPRTTVRMPHLRPSSGPLSEPAQAVPSIPLPAGAGPVGEDDKTNPVRVPSASPSPLTQTARGVGETNLRPIKMPPLEGPADEIEDDIPTTIRERDKGFVSVPGGLRRPVTSPPAADSKPEASAGAPVPPAPPVSMPGQADLPASPSAAGVDQASISAKQDEVSEPAIELISVVEEIPGPPPPPVHENVEPPASPAEPPAAQPADSAAPRAPQSSGNSASFRKRRPAATDSPSPRVQEATSWDPLTPVPRDGRAIERNARASRDRRMGTRSAASSQSTGRKGGGAWKWLVLVLVLGAMAGGGYIAYDKYIAGSKVVAHGENSDARADDLADGGAGDAEVVAVLAQSDAGAGLADAGRGLGDAGADIVDAADAPADADTGEPTKLTIRSKPKRAKVYLDGSPQGKTPATLDATSDRHRLALILPGYKLYTAEIDGSGTIDVALEEVASPEGPAGIKVRCSKKNRYYVFVDGIATGQLCPTERIGVDVGDHVVEIYDPVTDSRREFPVTVEGTRRSLRVRVD